MPTTDSVKSPALLTGTAVYTPSLTLLRNLVNNRLINQLAYLYFDLRQRNTTTPALNQTLTATNYSLVLTHGAILSVLCQAWAGGLIRNFVASYRIAWRLEPTDSGQTEAEIKASYNSGLMNLKLYVYEAIAFQFAFGTIHTFDYEAFATRWGVKLTDLAFWLRDMERRSLITLTLVNGTATINWHSPAPVRGLNRAELQKLLELKHLSKKGYAFIAFKAVRPTNGILDTSSLEISWAIAPEKVFEYAAEYQSRGIASIYIENVSINWVEMPPYWEPAVVNKRSGMLRQHGYLWFAMRSENPQSLAVQAIRVSAIATNWKLDTEDVIRYLRRLNSLGVIKADLSQVSITWYW